MAMSTFRSHALGWLQLGYLERQSRGTAGLAVGQAHRSFHNRSASELTTLDIASFHAPGCSITDSCNYGKGTCDENSAHAVCRRFSMGSTSVLPAPAPRCACYLAHRLLSLLGLCLNFSHPFICSAPAGYLISAPGLLPGEQGLAGPGVGLAAVWPPQVSRCFQTLACGCLWAQGLAVLQLPVVLHGSTPLM